VYSVVEVAASGKAETPAIGTLNEGALHAQLKDWYRRRGDRIEQVVDGFVVDLVRGNLLVEIQTGSFAPLRRKLDLLTRPASGPSRRAGTPGSQDHQALRRRRDSVGPSFAAPGTGGGHFQPARQHSLAALLPALRARVDPQPPRRASRLPPRPGLSSPRLGRGRPAARVSRTVHPHRLPERCRQPASARPSRPLRHRPTRRGSLSRAPARPTDDLLPASNGRPRHRRQTRQRHPPPPRREPMDTCSLTLALSHSLHYV
jgi:hypothetical protein